MKNIYGSDELLAKTTEGSNQLYTSSSPVARVGMTLCTNSFNKTATPSSIRGMDTEFKRDRQVFIPLHPKLPDILETNLCFDNYGVQQTR